jgi:hypothetical protein
MQGAQGRGMRRTKVRRSDESNCSNAAVGEFLRRHLVDVYHKGSIVSIIVFTLPLYE